MSPHLAQANVWYRRLYKLVTGREPVSPTGGMVAPSRAADRTAGRVGCAPGPESAAGPGTLATRLQAHQLIVEALLAHGWTQRQAVEIVRAADLRPDEHTARLERAMPGIGGV